MFSYDEASVDAILTALSGDRTTSYFALASPRSDKRVALQLYV